MSLEQQPENKKEDVNVPEIRKGLNFVFKQNPELKEIGTPEQYSRYLDTIFPESKFRDIAYHGTRKEFVGDAFKTDEVSNARNFGEGIYFSPNLDKPEIYAGDKGKIMSVILKIDDPFITDSHWNGWYKCFDTGFPENAKLSQFINGKKSLLNYDYLNRDSFKKINDYMIEYIGEKDKLGLPTYQKEIYQNPELKEIVIENPKDIHILGSKKDIEGFKNFVEEDKRN